MKKITVVISTVIMLLIIFGIVLQYKETRVLTEKIKNIKQTIEQRQDINSEYSTLLEQIKEKNLDKEIPKEKEIEKNNNEKIETLQNDINIKQQINEELLNKIEKIQIKLAEKLEQSTVKIDKEITYSQFPKYPTGCESISLYILLKYNGINTTPEEVINRLKLGELPYELDGISYGGNPEIEFIGDPRNDYSYGVFNGPIADVARTYKEGINSRIGLELEEVLELVKQNRPVMVWTTINNMQSEIKKSWIYKPTGEMIYWKSKEHAVVVIGYNDKYIIASDPYNGKIMKYERNKFQKNYNYLGKRAVYY